MLAIICPKCGVRLSAADSCRGLAVACGSCGASVFIASAEPTPSLEVTDFSPQGRRRRRQSSPMLQIGGHLLISGVFIYMGYRLYMRINEPPLAPKIVAAKQEVTPPRPRPNREPAERPIQPRREPPPRQPTPEPIILPSSPFLGVPASIDLPPTDMAEIVPLMDGLEATAISLLTNSPALKLEETKFTHSARTIAGLRVSGGRLEFRWTQPTPEAEADLRNSILQLDGNGYTHFVTLRMPERAEAPSLDLTKAVIRIYGRYSFRPPVEHIRFAFTGAAAMPEFTLDGADLAALKVGDEPLLRYGRGVNAATRITMKKRNGSASVEIESRYELPSGDTESLTIVRGNRKLRQLGGRLNSAINASDAIGGLQAYRSRLNGNLRRAQMIDTFGYVNGVLVENPVRVAQKTTAIRQIQNEMAVTERNIANAQALIDDRLHIERDLAALRQVAELAASLHNSLRLTYRFYAFVGGQEVTLLIGEAPNRAAAN